MKKTIAFFLAALLLLMLAGCGAETPAESGTSVPAESTGEPAESTASVETEQTTVETEAKEDGRSKLIGYEDVNFGNKTFVIAAQDNSSGDGWYTTKEVYPDTSMTDAISVAVRERNTLVESLYQCKIEMKKTDSPTNLVAMDITGQKYTIDLYTYEYGGAGMYTSGNNYNLLNYIDVSHPWWDQNYVADLSIRSENGAKMLFGIVGDFSITSFACTHVLFYNKDVYENADIGYDIDALVEAGEWTMDTFADIVFLAKHDTDGNQAFHYAEGDTLGWVRTGHTTHGMHVASGLRILQNTDGVLSFAMGQNEDAWLNMMDQAISIWNTEGAETLEYTDVQRAIQDGKAIFASEVLEVIERMKDEENLSVGLLPYPKYSEEQEDYAHYVDCHMASYCMPISVEDPELVGKFFEVYAYHSKYTVREAFVKTYATVYCNDSTSEKNLERILNSRTYDPGYLFWSDVESQVGNMVSGTNNVTGFIDKFSAVLAERIGNFVQTATEKNLF